jgi:gliding motility-associated-like protein
MKKSLVFLTFFLTFFSSKINASHIVGGELGLVYSGRGYVYNAFMNMYFDDINAVPGLLESDLTINIIVYNKATNKAERVFQLKRITNDFISYSNNGCSDPGTLRTRLLQYVGTVDLSNLNEPQGYYISWERCCRNYQTLNIVQQDFLGNYISGQVFYLELPPVSKAGTRFINSSPVFGIVPAQYLCKNNFAKIDFSAKDPDGDSLVYKMTTPLKGHTTEYDAVRDFPGPAPYDSIGWIGGYSAYNAIHGNPSLYIDKVTGELTVNPSETELFAFAIVCEEYRNGVKIGEVRRDFQFLIKDCPVTHPPSVGINSKANTSTTNWSASTPDTIVVKLNKDTCYTIYVTDSSASFYNATDNLTISYGSSNLPRTSLAFYPNQVTVSPANDTTTLYMCFSTCDKVLIERDSVYFLDIVVQDGDANTCPRRSDTLRTYIYVDVDETNNLPVISTSLDPTKSAIVHPDSLVSFYVYGVDPDTNDIKVIKASGYRFTLEEYRMQFVKVYGDPDSVAYLFTWVPTCEDLKSRLEYKIDFTLKDKSCIYTHNASTEVILRLQDVDTGLQNLVPTNLITPNEDGKNDCFHLPNLPPDNCTYIFKSVEIFNRWGARVYSSSDRNFSWCPVELSDGIYYYGIDLSEKFVKGWIQILR